MKARRNPFRSERMHELPYRFLDGAWSDFWSKLERAQFRGAIVGPEGSGKTTLLEEIQQRLRALGLKPLLIRIRVNDQRVAEKTIRDALAQLSQQTVLLVDSFEQLHLRQQLRLVLRSRRAAGIIVTAHRRCILPTLHTTQTNEELLRSLVTQLDSSNELPSSELRRLFLRHQGNLRTALRELYDRSAASAA